jgi:carbamate kinase
LSACLSEQAAPGELGAHDLHGLLHCGFPSAVQARPIELLLENSVTVICCGGGGIPVVEGRGTDSPEAGVSPELPRHRRLHGSECVIDKDAATAVLAQLIHADVMLLLTDADAVFDPRRYPDEKVMDRQTGCAKSTLRMEDFAMTGCARPCQWCCGGFAEALGEVGPEGGDRQVDAAVHN